MNGADNSALGCTVARVMCIVQFLSIVGQWIWVVGMGISIRKSTPEAKTENDPACGVDRL